MSTDWRCASRDVRQDLMHPRRMRRQNILVEQSGVISRAQAQANGLSEGDIRRLLRRREWVKVHPGVYVNHTGELDLAPASVGSGAVRLAGRAEPRLGTPRGRRARKAQGGGHPRRGDPRSTASRPLPDVYIHRMTHLHARTQWNLGPPRVRYEDAALDVAIASSYRSRSPGRRRIRGPVAAYDGSADARPARRSLAHTTTSLVGGRPRGRGDWGLLGARARVPGPRRTGSWPPARRTTTPCDRDPGCGLPRRRVRDVDRGARRPPVPRLRSPARPRHGP